MRDPDRGYGHGIPSKRLVTLNVSRGLTVGLTVANWRATMGHVVGRCANWCRVMLHADDPVY